MEPEVMPRPELTRLLAEIGLEVASLQAADRKLGVRLRALRARDETPPAPIAAPVPEPRDFATLRSNLGLSFPELDANELTVLAELWALQNGLAHVLQGIHPFVKEAAR